MALTLDKTNIQTGLTIEALQVSQSVDAFTGAQNYDITIGNSTDPALSGSLKITGSLHLSGSYNKFDMGPAIASTGYVVQIDDATNTISKASIASGTKGAQGVSGDKGAAGPIGTQGADGAGGSVGAKGDLGPQGSPGSQGASGQKGDDGSTGTQGTIGNTGPQGNAGPAGAQGETGAGGSKGDIGTQGETGAGTQGATGGTGPQGSQGTIGNTGPTGPTGPQGVIGTKGADGTVGAKGDKGEIGVTGPQGGQGDKGDTGSAGAKGDKGEIGTQGADGEKGQKGQEGVGTQGATGGDGEKGQKGELGVKGDNGEKGQKGEVGADSTVAGPQGTIGTKGDNGPDGSAGAKGDLGPQGTIGTTGTQGTIGDKGAEGSGGGGATSFNSQITYVAKEVSNQHTITLTTSGNVYGGLTWSRSSTTLTITSTAHGLTTSDYVVIRNMSADYQYLQIQSVVDANTFTLLVADSGGASGTEGAYIPACRISALTGTTDITAATIAAPTVGNIRINNFLIFAQEQSENMILTVPTGLTNGNGYGTDQTIAPVVFNARTVESSGTAGGLTGGTSYQVQNNQNQITLTGMNNGEKTVGNVIF